MSTTPASSCTTADGAIEVSASGGSAPFSFSVGGGKPQSGGVFSNLLPGSYLVLITDALGCSKSLNVVVGILNSSFQVSIKSTSPDTDCLLDNGSVEIAISGGTKPYQISFSGGAFLADSVFSNLAAGLYNLQVKDGSQCIISLSALVDRGITNVSYGSDILPLLQLKCGLTSNTCHSSNSGLRDLTTYDKVKAKASLVKQKTGDGSMPKPPQPGGGLSVDQIKLIACWVDDGALNN